MYMSVFGELAGVGLLVFVWFGLPVLVSRAVRWFGVMFGGRV